MAEQVGLGYAYLQLAKAIATGNSTQVAKWKDVIAAIRQGDVKIGERTPVSGMPIWATPAVVRGGFTSGAYAAGGALQPFEVALANQHGIDANQTGQCREGLNAWHLSPAGRAYLRDLAERGAFDAQLPEETALLAVALLDDETADPILATIAPYFDRLRFYPRESAPRSGDGVFLRNVGQVRTLISKKRCSAHITLQDATLTVWIPLYDRLADLLDGPLDKEAALRWVADYNAAKDTPRSKRWSNADGYFERFRQELMIRAGLERRSGDFNDFIRSALERRKTKYPDTKTRAALRQAQRKQLVQLKFDRLGTALAYRMASLREDVGVAETAPLCAPISAAEAAEGLPTGSILPDGFAQKIKDLQIAPIEQHVASGHIPSPEVLAALLPQVTADIHAQGFESDALRQVYKSTYTAFRNRRSLLLLNYQHQARLHELPWAAALTAKRTRDHDDRALAKASLTETARLALTHFPHVQFPNPLVEELRALALAADLDLPFTGEIAADIFMGDFSEQFTKAAHIGVSRYAGTLYGAYYGITPDLADKPLGKTCARLAGPTGKGWSVVSNAKVIEQQLILTTHNIAPLFATCDLSQLDLSKMPVDCFIWICDSQQNPRGGWRARLQSVKNAAYAWRQMLLFLSEMPRPLQSRTLSQIEAHFAEQPPAFRTLFAPALIGLQNAAHGKPIDQNGGRKFLGWVEGQHPFVAATSDA